MKRSHRNQRKTAIRRAKRRQGAAFLILVILVLLVVTGSTKAFLIGELGARRGEVSRLHARSLAAAIEAARNLDGTSTTSIQLPINESKNERIEVRINAESSTITAQWINGDQIVDEMVRPIDPQNAEADR